MIFHIVFVIDGFIVGEKSRCIYGDEVVKKTMRIIVVYAELQVRICKRFYLIVKRQVVLFLVFRIVDISGIKR